MIIGLLMVAILAAHEKRWTLSAVALGFSAYLKIYPLSVGLLLVLLYPRQLGWRLALTLILMGAASFLASAACLRPGAISTLVQHASRR